MPEKRDAAADMAVCDRATEGPWDRIKRSTGGFQPDPAYCGPSKGYTLIYGFDGNRDNDIAFVAMARDALPYWIREAERMKDEVEMLRKTVSGLADRVVAQSELLSRRAEKGGSE